MMGTGNRQIVLADYSPTQYAGFGYTGDALFYQTPSALGRHIFRANAADFNEELMRVQNTPTGAQVGIGLTGLSRIIEPGTGLKVSGTTRIQGDLVVSGVLSSACNFLSATAPVPLSVLPSNLVYTQSNNKIDDSLLTAGYNFQYLKSQKNVGIGTRYPAQKFHVQGSIAVSDRIGIGTIYPSNRIHVVESASSICTVRIENTQGGNLIEAYGSNSAPALFLQGTPQCLGIGTSNLDPSKALIVEGDSLINGDLIVTASLSAASLSTSNLSANSINIAENMSSPILRTQMVTDTSNNDVTALSFYTPLIARSSFYANSIAPYQGTLIYLNGSTSTSGSTTFAKQPYTISTTADVVSKTLITNAVSKINAINGYMCSWQNGDLTPALLAEEVANIIPEAVRTTTDGQKTLIYDSIIAVLVQAVHELSAP
jgi:hypothetical protein